MDRAKAMVALAVFVLCSGGVQAQRHKVGPTERNRYDNDTMLCPRGEWRLVFEDDFDGECVDTGRWQLRPWGYGSYGNVQEYNTMDNVEVRDGMLRIEVRREDRTARAVFWQDDTVRMGDGVANLREYHYTSSSLWTREKFGYGRFEARIRIPKGRGIFPAFWLFGADPWNEIDIFEFWNNSGRRYDATRSASLLHATVHYDYDGDGRTDMVHTQHRGVDYGDDFHVFALEWTGERIAWYVDGELIREYYSHYRGLGRRPSGCLLERGRRYRRSVIYPRDAMQMILNVAVQSGEDGPDDGGALPVAMEVDWVRVYAATP